MLATNGHQWLPMTTNGQCSISGSRIHPQPLLKNNCVFFSGTSFSTHTRYAEQACNLNDKATIQVVRSACPFPYFGFVGLALSLPRARRGRGAFSGDYFAVVGGSCFSFHRGGGGAFPCVTLEWVEPFRSLTFGLREGLVSIISEWCVPFPFR